MGQAAPSRVLSSIFRQVVQRNGGNGGKGLEGKGPLICSFSSLRAKPVLASNTALRMPKVTLTSSTAGADSGGAADGVPTGGADAGAGANADCNSRVRRMYKCGVSTDHNGAFSSGMCCATE